MGTFLGDKNVFYFILGSGYMDIYKYIIVKIPRAENPKPVRFIVVNYVSLS